MNEATRREREKRVRESDGCDICRADAAVVHEIARGTPHRQKALLASYATLVLCSPCHDLKVHQGMSVAEQLAFVFVRRPDEFELNRFWELTGRMWPSNLEVWKCVKKIRKADDERRGW